MENKVEPLVLFATNPIEHRSYRIGNATHQKKERSIHKANGRSQRIERNNNGPTREKVINHGEDGKLL